MRVAPEKLTQWLIGVAFDRIPSIKSINFGKVGKSRNFRSSGISRYMHANQALFRTS